MNMFVNWLRRDQGPLTLYGIIILIVAADLAITWPIATWVEPLLPKEAQASEEEFLKLFGADGVEKLRKLYNSGSFHLIVALILFSLALMEELIFRTIPLGVSVSAQRGSWFAVSLILIGTVLTGMILWDSKEWILAQGRDPIILTVLGLTVAGSMIASMFTKSVVPILIIIIASSSLFAYAHLGWISLVLQGFGGLTLCVIYLKCGGIQGNWIKATWYATVAHMLFNLAVVEISFYQLLTA